MDSFYKYHVFFCLNQRDPGSERPSCKAGCLDRCEEGPAVVVYPEGTWYTYVDESDIDEIVESHLANGKVVERLRIDR
jgi:(2Fe-2S) ferredoxin